MHTLQRAFIDRMIEPIPFVGPLMADVFHTVAGLAEAMNLRTLADTAPPAPPADNVVALERTNPAEQIRIAA